MNTDIVIIGAGPAGIFTAMELLRRGSKEKILLLEKGHSIETRKCPKAQTGRCMNCKPYCHITTGFSGAGAFSDGKLSLSPEVGGDLPQLIGEDTVQSLIEYTDSIYLEFGADTRVEGVSEKEAVKEIRKRAIQTGLKLVDCPTVTSAQRRRRRFITQSSNIFCITAWRFASAARAATSF